MGEDPFRVALSDPTEVDLLAQQTNAAGARLRAALHVLAVAAPYELLLACLELTRAVFVRIYLGRLGRRLDTRRENPKARPLEECESGGEAEFGVERTVLLLAAALKKSLYGRAGKALGEPLILKLLGAKKVGSSYRERYVLAVGSRVAGSRVLAGCFRKPRTTVRLFCCLGRSESIPGVWTLRWCVQRKVRPSGNEAPYKEALSENSGLYAMYASPHARDALSVFFKEEYRSLTSTEYSRRITEHPGSPEDVSGSEEAKAPAA